MVEDGRFGDETDEFSAVKERDLTWAFKEWYVYFEKPTLEKEVVMRLTSFVFGLCLFLISPHLAYYQEEEVSITPDSEAGESLDLQAVMQLFKDSESAEDFEKSLNTPENGVNNLDLNEDGEVDYIRVIEYAEDGSHLFVLQVPLAEDEYQDVATLQVEKNGDEVTVLAEGDSDIYGKGYCIQPVQTAVVTISTWPIIRVIYAPGYRLWISPWRWRNYPRWWKPWGPVTRTAYRTWIAAMKLNTVFRPAVVRHSLKVYRIYKPHRRISSLAAQKTKKTHKQAKPPAKIKKPKKKNPKLKKYF